LKPTSAADILSSVESAITFDGVQAHGASAVCRPPLVNLDYPSNAVYETLPKKRSPEGSRMRKVALFSLLLILGMIGSQLLAGIAGEAYPQTCLAIQVLTVVGLAFIMIHVGYEFEIDKSNLRQYGWDYVVAMTTAAFPWIFASVYFVFVMLPADTWGLGQTWKESLLAGRFAAPTSAGVLFAMLAAAGLSATWVFNKARILAIFDDVDTVLLMIPLKLLMIGAAWQLGISVVIMAVLLWLAWQYLHRWQIPTGWPWVMGYSFAIGVTCELVYISSKAVYHVPIHIEVLLPAFVLGCMLKRPAGSDPHTNDNREGCQEGPESGMEQRVFTIVTAAFMALVGLSMPHIIGKASGPVVGSMAATVTASQPLPSWWMICVHVVVLTILINLGKLFPLLCYRREAHWKERLALAIALWPRGEVGAGVLIMSLSFGIGGPIVIVALLCLALNLILTGVFIVAVKRLVAKVEHVEPRPAEASICPAVASI